MFIRRERFDISAIVSWAALIPMSHFGSSIGMPFCSAAPGGIETRQCTTRAHIEKAEAMGPNVPAIKGNAVLANHQRLGRVSF